MRTHTYLMLLFAVATLLPCGCQRSRLFSPLASRQKLSDRGPSMHGPSTLSQNVAQDEGIRVTNDQSPTGPEIEPVAQRLATTRPVSHVSQKMAENGQSDPVTTSSSRLDTELPTTRTNVNSHAEEPHATTTSPPPSDLSTSTPVENQPPSSKSDQDSAVKLPEQYSGVDISDLMEALKDAPPKVQQAAVARLIAMSRQRAQSSPQPEAIENQLADSLDSLPVLPDEVIDRGVSPTRIAASASRTSVPVASQHADTQSIATQAKLSSSVADPVPTPSDPQVAQATLQQPQAARDSCVQPISVAIDDFSDSITVQPTAAESVSIPPSAEANQSLPVDPASATMTDSELFDALVERLQTEVSGESESQRHRRLVMARHLMVLAGQPDRAVEKIEGLSTQEQEYLRHQLLGLWTIIDPNGHPVPSRRLTTALPQIRKATQHLSAATDALEVRSLQFCTEIEAYGQTKPFPSKVFRGGQEVILYCEIDNFVAKEVEQGHETILQGSYDILDSTGRRVSSQSLPESKQISSKRLRDYYIAYQMYLPDSLQAGGYQLRLTMEDVHGKKYGQATIEFELK